MLQNRFPGFDKISYVEQRDKLFASRVMYSDTFSRAMISLGQVAIEIVWDFEIIQKQWAVENSVAFLEEDWAFDILVAQINAIRPDVVYFQGTELAIPGRFKKTGPNTSLVTELKNRFPFIRLIVMFSGFPSRVSRIKDVDILLTCSPAVAEHYARSGVQSTLCYHAFDTSILDELQMSDVLYDFSFVGSARPPESRYWMLRELLEETSIELWIDEPEISKSLRSKLIAIKKYNMPLRRFSGIAVRKILKNCDSAALRLLVDRKMLPARARKMVSEHSRESNTVFNDDKPRLRQSVNSRRPTKTLQEMYPYRCHGPVVGLDYFRVLKNSRLTFNRHTDYALNSVGNMRLFEATGVGTCLLTDTGNNMKDLFEPDYEVVTYDSIEEAKEKLSYLMDHDSERENIAKAGHRRTIKEHTIFNRCQVIDELIQSKL
jgi:glycosyltransferase involved in cell wall biosynthesis